MERFVGYGRFSASTWFLGPEQAGIDRIDQLMATLRVWESLGSEAIVDLHEFHGRLGVTRFFRENPPTQPTWRKLIRIALRLEGSEPTARAVRVFQAERLGRSDGDTLLGELLPLPKKHYKSWPYASLAEGFPSLRDRTTYLRSVLPERVARLRALIAEHRPSRVCCYGTSGFLRDAWIEVCGGKMRPVEGGYLVGASDTTKYAIFDHPVCVGRSNAYFERVATLVA